MLCEVLVEGCDSCYGLVAGVHLGVGVVVLSSSSRTINIAGRCLTLSTKDRVKIAFHLVCCLEIVSS